MERRDTVKTTITSMVLSLAAASLLTSNAHAISLPGSGNRSSSTTFGSISAGTGIGQGQATLATANGDVTVPFTSQAQLMQTLNEDPAAYGVAPFLFSSGILQCNGQILQADGYAFCVTEEQAPPPPPGPPPAPPSQSAPPSANQPAGGNPPPQQTVPGGQFVQVLVPWQYAECMRNPAQGALTTDPGAGAPIAPATEQDVGDGQPDPQYWSYLVQHGLTGYLLPGPGWAAQRQEQEIVQWVYPPHGAPYTIVVRPPYWIAREVWDPTDCPIPLLVPEPNGGGQ